jgi:DNA ligase-1
MGVLYVYISPMLLHKSDEAFSNDTYLSELKYDGIRLTLSKWNGTVRLYTRHKNEVTNRFKELLDIDIPDGTVLDGEIIVPGTDDKPDFEAMMARFLSSKNEHSVQYCAFDILYYNGKSVMQRPLIERKELLEQVLPANDLFVFVRHFEGQGEALFNLIKEQALEGVVLKKADSIYKPGTRSPNWLKVINYQYEDIFITGLRKKEFGLLLSFKDGSPAGMLEFMKPGDKKIFYAAYKEHVSNESDDFIYLDPALSGTVKYRNLTKKGYLRIPSFEKWIV